MTFFCYYPYWKNWRSFFNTIVLQMYCTYNAIHQLLILVVVICVNVICVLHSHLSCVLCMQVACDLVCVYLRSSCYVCKVVLSLPSVSLYCAVCTMYFSYVYCCCKRIAVFGKLS